jgi:hypothetical protein
LTGAAVAVICRAATVAVSARWLTLDPERGNVNDRACIDNRFLTRITHQSVI